MDMKDEYFYVEFEIISSDRFKCFQLIFEKLKEIKNDWRQDPNSELKEHNLKYRDPVKDFNWHNDLDDDAIAWFEDTFDHHGEEGKTYRQLWDLTHYEHRLHPFF
ncbi:MAG: hypothetical protein ACRC06_02705, partial [Waterburya sp.]